MKHQSKLNGISENQLKMHGALHEHHLYTSSSSPTLAPELAAALLDLLHRVLKGHWREPVGPLPRLGLLHEPLGHPLPAK